MGHVSFRAFVGIGSPLLSMFTMGWQDQGVTMPLHEDEAPRLAEIGRRLTEVVQSLSDFRSEVRAATSEMVRKETYTVERDALKDRIIALEARSKTLQNLIYSGIGTIVVSVIVLWVTRGGA